MGPGHFFEPFGLPAHKLAQHSELMETRPPESPLAFGIRPPLLFDRFGGPPRSERHRKVNRRSEYVSSLERQRSVLKRQRAQPPVVTAFIKDWFHGDAPRQEGPIGSTDADFTGQMFCVGRQPRIGHIPLRKFFAQERWFIGYRRGGLTARRNASQFVQPVAQIPAEFTERVGSFCDFFESSRAKFNVYESLRADLTTSLAESDRRSRGKNLSWMASAPYGTIRRYVTINQRSKIRRRVTPFPVSLPSGLELAKTTVD